MISTAEQSNLCRLPAPSIEAPEVLRGLQGWVLYKLEPSKTKPGKFDKVPYYACTGKRRRGKMGSPGDRAQLVTFDVAVSALERSGFDGVGFATLPEFNKSIVDFDNSMNGHVHPFIAAIAFKTYTEFSPSGTGTHAIFEGAIPEVKSFAKDDRFGIEVFHKNGFVTFTGKVLFECDVMGAGPNVIAEAPPELLALIEERRAEKGQSDDAGDDVASEEAKFSRAVVLREANTETMVDLRDALMNGICQDGKQECDYHEWAEVIGQGLASLKRTPMESEAEELFLEFSAGSEKFDEFDAERRWNSFRPSIITFRSIFDLAQRKGWVNPRSGAALKAGSADDYAKLEDRTDTGNANLLVRLTDGNLRFVPERKLWLWWDGFRWVADDFGAAAFGAAKQVAQHYHAMALDLKRQAEAESLAKEERKRIGTAAEGIEKWAAHCRNKRTIDAMLALASRDARVVVSAADLDTDPWLLGVANGVVDLHTGQLRAAAREELVTLRSPIEFDPIAKAPRWFQFIDEITGTPLPAEFDTKTGLIDPQSIGRYTARPALSGYLQLALGYCLTGTVVEHKMFFAIGPGANGKNILLDTMQEVMGGYCKTIPPEALMAIRHDADSERPSPTAATLAGARLAVSSESRDGQKLDVALVKRHTGGGFMTARLLRENTFTFPISHKLWLMTNHRPGLDHMDDALRGRLHLIPFVRSWNRPGHPARDEELPDGDKDLMARLRAEAPGILSWLIEGAVRYVKEGLEPPAEVVKMTRTYFAEQDPIGRWLEAQERCQPQQGVLASLIFARFIKDTGTESSGITEKAFCMAMGNRYGIAKCKKKAGIHYGLRLEGSNDPGKVQGAG